MCVIGVGVGGDVDRFVVGGRFVVVKSDANPTQNLTNPAHRGSL